MYKWNYLISLPPFPWHLCPAPRQIEPESDSLMPWTCWTRHGCRFCCCCSSRWRCYCSTSHCLCDCFGCWTMTRELKANNPFRRHHQPLIRTNASEEHVSHEQWMLFSKPMHTLSHGAPASRRTRILFYHFVSSFHGGSSITCCHHPLLLGERDHLN